MRRQGCKVQYGLARSGGAIRQALFMLERDVCTTCRADCHALVRRLKAVKRGLPVGRTSAAPSLPVVPPGESSPF